ncbi:MAG: multiheme c-type cytochrome [Acidobacteriota bacterium]
MKKSYFLFIALLAAGALFMTFAIQRLIYAQKQPNEQEVKDTLPKGLGVCPPFPLRDEKGEVINPVKGINDKVPYSPKQTCGAKGCHNYEKITQGFHFQQGKGEAVPQKYGERYNWVLYPGNYGGNWCSPAPLYRQLAPKHNTNPRLIDMTSFEFVTATCGNCHPGGGPLEYDRNGRRYDECMNDPSSGFSAGGDNGLDGDYYRARWNETGVIEADCLLCHQPEYNFKKRNDEIGKLHFKWAATAGAKFGNIVGSVKNGVPIEVIYDKSLFDDNGNVTIHIVPEPRSKTCLNCHFKPDWKKRGAGYSERTDVHMMAGLKCVDCHAAGSKAANPRILGKEIHQFGKGDDPSGFVRNDLDNTVRSCEDCHLKGYRNAPVAKHNWLPPLHLDKLACQVCHIPNRANASALVQASDVYNSAPRISPPPKHIWTFYDQKMNFWNHYGELELFGAEDKPTDISDPTLIRYKGKIFPANVVHSTFVGFEEEGRKGLNQLFMKDFYSMWMEHRSNPDTNYPELKVIKDDNKDSVLEINSPEEIDAILSASRKYLEKTGFPLVGKKVVYVSDARVYYSSNESRELPKEEYEATPYASVYKYSHDVAPAKAALGARGCTDCHSGKSSFFYGKALKTPFSPKDAKPEWMPKYKLLGLSGFWVKLGELRETILKKVIYFALCFFIILILLLFFSILAIQSGAFSENRVKYFSLLFFAASVVGFFITIFSPGLFEYMTISRFTLDSLHFWVGCLLIVALLSALLLENNGLLKGFKRGIWLTGCLALCFSAISGIFMLLKIGWLDILTRLSYTAFDLSLAIIALGLDVYLFFKLVSLKKTVSETGLESQ